MKKYHLIVLIIAIALAAALIIVPLVLDESEDPTPDIPDASEYADRDVSGRNVARITMNIANYGEIKLLLDATSAPRTVANFLTLAKSGFYNGLDFFAISRFSEEETVIFGGDPSMQGREPSTDTIKGEFKYNGISNDLKIKRGVITMFYSGNDTDSATSLFFFSNCDIPDLDGYFAPFGYVVSGYGVLAKMIEDGVYCSDTYGVIESNRRPIITSITVEQDIDYSLVADVYVAPPTSAELADLIGESDTVKRVTASTGYDSLMRAYSTSDAYLLQMIGKIEDEHAHLLLSINDNGSIIGAKALSYTGNSVIPLVPSLVGLDLSAIESSNLPDGLKKLASDAIRATRSFSSSEYAYSRDTEGRETYTVEMKIQGYDTPVVILLDKTTAPITVANFLSLVEKGFYNGLDFHRIIKGFMIQGGDGSHLPQDQQATSIKGEFASNGHENDIKHLRGTISMARATNPDSASSGFFICDATSPHLDGDYAAFGYVISGMQTVDAIADYAVGKTDGNGNLNVGVAQPTIEYIKIVEN